MDGRSWSPSGRRGATACQEELPAIQAEVDGQPADGLAVVAVNYRQTDRSALSAYLRAAGFHLGGALDPAGRIAQAYGVIGLPTSVLVDRLGVVTAVQVGAITPAQLQELVRAAG